MATLALALPIAGCAGASTPPKSLHDSASRGDLAAVQALLAQGAEADIRDAIGATPLHVAAGAGQLPVVLALLAHGASVNAKDRTGATPLMVAAISGHPDVVLALKKAGAKGEGELGRVGLDLAVSQGQLYVYAVVPGSPAEKAGLQPRDRIVEINGQSTRFMNFKGATTKMRGPKGGKVVLVIRRNGSPEPMTVTVVRDAVGLGDGQR